MRHHRDRARYIRGYAQQRAQDSGFLGIHCKEVIEDLLGLIEELADVVEVLAEDEITEHRAVSLEIAVEGQIMSAATIQDDQKVTLTGVLKDDAGNVVAPTAAFVWSASDGSVVALTPAGDTFSAVATSGVAGTATVTVTDGTLTGTCDVTVVAAPPPPPAATSLDIEVGTPEAK